MLNPHQKPLPKPKDLTQERLDRLERTVDFLRRHLLSTLELTYALAAELAETKGREQSKDPICTKLLAEFNTLSTLKTTQRDFNQRR
ncbi:MAG: hypothetical protein RM049_13560 [Nostoc sp. DedQUE04]|uniref:hypothetical protein n=1 Tax=Nostoc sp. DedQUE04 TaxID=3075390 RepID=UPI002AD32F31|nr:hypothetical protein [Nostoc sp. DedQUE04]MDZ8135134.1 hypothetical protein [Nostoc sp. DedQUE04]MDZ8136314.1 hypothetical protein [Nostoc sp. DedQUE04]